MATIIFDKLATKLDGSVKAAVMGFLEKLGEDDTLPGLHIEPIQRSADPRVRTGRVNQDLRAVLFKVTGDGVPYYLFHGVWPHDEAIAKAGTITLTVNPINGQAMIREAAAVGTPDPGPGGVGVPPPASLSWLVQRGFFADGLVNQLGLPREVAERAMAVTSDDALMNLAEQEDGWIADALLDLAAETPLSTIVERLDLVAPKPAPTASQDDQLIQALRTPAAMAQFAFIGSQDELRHVIEDGDFGQWRVFLHPEQRRYATQSYAGSFRLSGAAGTGKTVVLVHRAKMLAERNPHARIVLTTFARNLSDALRESLADLDSTVTMAKFGEAGVAIYGVDALVAAVLKRAGDDVAGAVGLVLGQPRTEVHSRTNEKAWSDVIDVARAYLPPEIANETFFQAEYATVVLPGRITTLEEYLRVRRPGRGVALNREKRKSVWGVIANYRAQSRVLGTVDFPEAAAIAAAWCETRQAEPLADHVLIDEGQDLSAPQWQFLRALVPEGSDDLFIAEDAHQRIYGQRITLGHYGIATVGRSRRLTLNYRTTAQNLRAAMTTLQGGDYRDIEGETVEIQGYRSARTGPEPEYVTVATRDEETQIAASRIRAWIDADPDLPLETIAVLVHDQRSRDRMVDDLADHGIAARSIDRQRPLPGKVLVMTMYRAKGLEFAKVIIAGHGAWPGHFKGLIKAWDPSMQDEADLRERSLIYVAMTRARDELVVVSR